jgi:hypothetical protein
MPRALTGARWQRVLLVGVAPLFVSAAVVTTLIVRFQTVFLTNDDMALASLVRGDYTGKPSSSLVVSPAMFGHILRVAHWLIPNLPWYGIALYTLEIISFTVIGIAAFTLQRRPPIAERIIVAAALVALAPWMILRVSFTPTSLMLGISGILLFAVAAKVPGRLGVTYAVVAGVLLGSAVLIRTYSFVALVVVFAPVLAIIALRAGLRRSAVFGVAVLVLVLLSVGTNRLEYSRSAEWRAFKQMNSARGWLHDTPRLYDRNVSQSDLRKIGWTRNDLWLFGHFLYPDPEVYSDHSIRELSVLSPRVRNVITTQHIFDVIVHDSSDRPDDRGPVLASLAIIGILLALRRSRVAAAVTVVSLIWFVAVITLLLLYVRLPGRVLIPLETGAALFAAVLPAYLAPARPPAPAKSRSWISVAVIAVVALFAFGPVRNGIHSIWRIDRVNQVEVETSHVTLARLHAFDPRGIFVARGDRFGRSAEPLSTDLPYENPNLIGLGWTTNSPLFKARLDRIGIDDVYTSLETNRHVYLVANRREAERIAEYYRQHRRRNVPLRVVAGPLAKLFDVTGIYIWSASPARAP